MADPAGDDTSAAPSTTEPARNAAPEASVAGYEHARDELADVVRRLEEGGLTLEESLALWERGEDLARICQEWLNGARSRIDAVLADETEPPSAGNGR